MEGMDSFFLHFKAFAFALPRFLAVFTMLPLLSKEALPLTLRMGVIGSFAVILAPTMVEGASVQRDSLVVIGILAKEFFIGILLGFVFAIPFWALEMMGDLCDTQRGATIAQTLNPLTSHESSPLGQLFSQALVTLLFAIGGFVLLLGTVYDSFSIWPVFGWWPHFAGNAPKLALQMLDQFMSLTVLLAAPVIFSMFLAEAGMALISRFVPQLQVFFLAMPVKSGIAMAVFAIYGVILFDYAGEVLRSNIRQASRTISQMIPGVAR
jgi:type III secretion protein T